jgi:hypothetical protein
VLIEGTPDHMMRRSRRQVLFESAYAVVYGSCGNFVIVHVTHVRAGRLVDHAVIKQRNV